MEYIDSLRMLILMMVTRNPKGEEWIILLNLIRSLAKEIDKPKLLRAARQENDIALFEITNILGIDDEEKEIIFENLFCDNEKTGETKGRDENEEIYESKEYN